MRSHIFLKSFLLFAAVLLVSSKTREIKYERFLTVNDLVDGVLNQIRKLIIKEEFDPMTLPDYEASFLHIGLLGKLKLKECKLYNISTVFRSDDIKFNRVNTTLKIRSATFGFDKLKLNCTYDASLLAILHKKGEAVVNIPNLNAEVDFDLHLNNITASLNDLNLVNNGPIDVHLEGGLLDGLVSILTQTISNLFKVVILNQVEKRMEDALRKIMEGEKRRESQHTYKQPYQLN